MTEKHLLLLGKFRSVPRQPHTSLKSRVEIRVSISAGAHDLDDASST